MDAVNSFAAPNLAEEAWRAIADLRLRPRRTLHYYRHVYRGEPWLIIADQHGERYYRCSAAVEPFLRLLDGTQTIEQALAATRRSSAGGLRQADIVLLIANMKAAGLLLDDDADTDGDAAATPKARANSWLRPFALRFALLDPDRWLRKNLRWYRPLFGPVALRAWCGLVALALVGGWLHWPQLLEHGASRFADPRNLLWYWLLYPLVKALHELGHACATRVWGGAVREMGIMLLVFFPVPYVDSSAAHRFACRKKRMLVSAAGVMAEVFVAALALLVWIYSDPGLLRDLAFDIVLIGGVSTLLFNANPLLRFDGYYLLSELIEIPNLSTRSSRYLGYLFKHRVLDIPGLRSPVTARGEAKWLFAYGVSAGIYRVFITLAIAAWVAGKFFIVGVALALWGVIAQVLYPAVKSLAQLLPLLAQTQRLRRFGAVLTALSMVSLTALLVPTGHGTHAEGIVNLPDNALIRAGADGIVAEVPLADGASAAAGDVVVRLENLALEARRDMLSAKLEQTRALQQQAFLRDRSQADVLKVKVSSQEADLRDVEMQIDNLTVVAGTPGIVSLPLASDLPGRYIRRGDVIGYIAGAGRLTAQVVVPQADIDPVRRNRESIAVRLSGLPNQTFGAEFLRELPGGTDQLPDRRLGSAAGGTVAVDNRDQSGMKVLSNVFLVEIGLPLKITGQLLGQRVYVRFEHGRESLYARLRRGLDRLLLRAARA